MARVLLIDDQADTRAWMHRVLKRDGFEVLEARDALAGLQRAVEDDPDLILIPTELAGWDAIDLCLRLSREPVIRSVPVVLMGSSDDEAENRRATRAGAAAVLRFSSRADDMTRVIREQLWGIRQGELFGAQRPGAHRPLRASGA